MSWMRWFGPFGARASLRTRGALGLGWIGNPCTATLGLVALGLSLSPPAAVSTLAATGTFLINEACAESGSGCFPGDTPGTSTVEITVRGSYSLASNLDVDQNTSAVTISADDVVLDLNGFSIVGAALPGTGHGVVAVSNAERSVVKGGAVVGVGGYGLDLGHGSRVEGMTISGCSAGAVRIVSSGFVSNSFIEVIAGYGVESTTPSAGLVSLSGNVIEGSGTGSHDFDVVEIGGNRCWDGRCSSGLRAYYLSVADLNQGSDAPTVCAPGFHFASLREIASVSELRYDGDAARSYTRADAGLGPPENVSGWVRTGYVSSIASAAGAANCAVWTSISAGEYGTTVSLDPDWTNGNARQVSPWEAFAIECNQTRRVWCIQD